MSGSPFLGVTMLFLDCKCSEITINNYMNMPNPLIDTEYDNFIKLDHRLDLTILQNIVKILHYSMIKKYYHAMDTFIMHIN